MNNNRKTTEYTGAMIAGMAMGVGSMLLVDKRLRSKVMRAVSETWDSLKTKQEELTEGARDLSKAGTEKTQQAARKAREAVTS